MGRVVVVGSANTDMILQCARLPRPGETVLGGSFTTAAGGKGANQAVAAARVGADVTFVTRLGRDWLGDQALANYRSAGINCDYVSRDDELPSGVALIMVDDAAENIIGVASGANGALTPREVEQAEPAIRAADVLLVQLEIPLESAAAALRLARRHGVRAILNPAPATELPPEMLQDAILTPNETEAVLLSGADARSNTDPRQAVATLLDRSARQVILTLGKDGALLVEGGGSEHVPGFTVKAVDTTAAGDAFNGGLARALSDGADLRSAIRYACAVGALSVTKLGAQPSLPSGAEVDAFLAQHATAE